MGADLISKYVWLIDLLTRYGRLTRGEINRHWMMSSHSGGDPMPERTFFHFRRAIEDNFGIEIVCNNYHEYSIKEISSKSDKAFVNWMVDSVAVSSAVRESPEVQDRIMVEEVPSAREFLGPVLEAIRDAHKIEFTYAGFSRSRPETGILFSPYFVRLYKQRWYMVGMKEDKKEIRTYALDRVRELKNTKKKFRMPKDLTPAGFFSNILGITYSQAEPKIVKLRATPSQAKYFRALPFHETQQEQVGDGYSVFTYCLKLNYELVHEILGLGSQVKVLAPRELQVMVKEELTKMTESYDDDDIN